MPMLKYIKPMVLKTNLGCIDPKAVVRKMNLLRKEKYGGCKGTYLSLIVLDTIF